jgi:hypothetical protein
MTAIFAARSAVSVLVFMSPGVQKSVTELYRNMCGHRNLFIWAKGSYIDNIKKDLNIINVDNDEGSNERAVMIVFNRLSTVSHIDIRPRSL